MKIEFQYEFADYREAARIHSTPPARGMRMLIALMMLCSVGCVIYSAIGPITAPPPGATTAPVTLPEIYGSIVPYVPFLFILPIGVILGRSKLKAARRRFDYVATSRNRWLSGVSAIFCSVILGVVSVAISNHRQSNLAAPSAGTTWIDWLPWSIILVFFWILFRGLYKRGWKQQPALARLRTLEYSSDGLTCSDDLITTTYRWAAFLRCVETSNLFLLYSSGLQFIMVPKRIFPSADAADEFRRLIQEWADGRSIGFPVIQAGTS